MLSSKIYLKYLNVRIWFIEDKRKWEEKTQSNKECYRKELEFYKRQMSIGIDRERKRHEEERTKLYSRWSEYESKLDNDHYREEARRLDQEMRALQGRNKTLAQSNAHLDKQNARVFYFHFTFWKKSVLPNANDGFMGKQWEVGKHPIIYPKHQKYFWRYEGIINVE